MAKNAYQMFVEETRPKVEAEHPEMTNAEQDAEVGRIWKSLSDAEKAEWQKKADAYK